MENQNDRPPLTTIDKTGKYVLKMSLPKEDKVKVYEDGVSARLFFKTAEEATPKGFGRQMIWSDDFKLQAAWYLALCKYALGVRPKGFRFIVVEKEAPFLTAVFELHADLIAEGEALMLQALKSYEACKSFNEWPSYSSEVQVIARPASTAQSAPINFA